MNCFGDDCRNFIVQLSQFFFWASRELAFDSKLHFRKEGLAVGSISTQF